KPLSYHCPITYRSDVLGFNDIFSHLSRLKLAVYAPLSYILPSRLKKYEAMYDTLVPGGAGKFRQIDRERSLQALMTVNLLKRLESSVHAFRLTLRSLQSNHAGTLGRIQAFKKDGRAASVADFTDALSDLDPEDDDLPGLEDLDGAGSEAVGGKIKINLADMDLPRWEHELTEDLKVIESLLASMEQVTPQEDAKLQHLKAHVLGKISQPINPGNRKVLIFTAFADTADYLYANLAPELLQRLRLHSAKVTGKDRPASTLKPGYDFQELLTLFSPRSKQRADVLPGELNEIDLLIGTDCISEGQNLQDCDYVINYDIHWNPVRIIQRFGRVDRIGSPNKAIQLVNYWPDISLDEYINLKERVESRMMIADVTATGDDNVLSAQSNDVSYRKEQLRRLQEEVIELEDVKTGVSITDLGLNDFRMDLLNYVKEHGELARTPNGMHAVVPAQPELGLMPGVIFTLRNRHNGVNVNDHNRLHPYYLVYISRQGEVIHDHSEVKRLLDLVRSACKGHDQPMPEACRRFNLETADGRQMQAYSDLLGQAIRSMIQVKEEKDLDSLFSGGRTTALVNAIAGLDDFELITFLVIQEGG
ncbi:MAG: ATP-dependent helicase, partial [Gallionella sp.]|nr:ATP-dependent helicase [Gallionella sp.]